MNGTYQEGLMKLRASYGSLSPSEKKVADLILHEPLEKTIYLSVSELAENAGVSDATVIRFCKNIGFKGYQEFKLVLARSLEYSAENINYDICSEDDLQMLTKKLALGNEQIIEESLALIDYHEVEKAVDILGKAQKIVFFGVGASGITCWDAKYKFLRIGKNVDYYTDSHLQAMSASTLCDKDVALGISHSGSSKDVVDCCGIAKEMGATVICITSYRNSPISKVADIKLLTAAKEGPFSSGALRYKTSQLYLLDILFTAVALKQGKLSIEYTEKTAQAVTNKFY